MQETYPKVPLSHSNVPESRHFLAGNTSLVIVPPSAVRGSTFVVGEPRVRSHQTHDLIGIRRLGDNDLRRRGNGVRRDSRTSLVEPGHGRLHQRRKQSEPGERMHLETKVSWNDWLTRGMGGRDLSL